MTKSRTSVVEVVVQRQAGRYRSSNRGELLFAKRAVLLQLTLRQGDSSKLDLASGRVEHEVVLFQYVHAEQETKRETT